MDYTFAQIGVAIVEHAGNCGNMSSTIGPFAVEEELVPCPTNGETVVRIHKTNTGKVISARFQVKDGLPVTAGDFKLEGISGTASPIRLEFLDPGGPRRASFCRLAIPWTGLTFPTSARSKRASSMHRTPSSSSPLIP
nr:PrpF domain-containing protein [Paracoccus indicus]